jgi:hypothetical protein
LIACPGVFSAILTLAVSIGYVTNKVAKFVAITFSAVFKVLF